MTKYDNLATKLMENIVVKHRSKYILVTLCVMRNNEIYDFDFKIRTIPHVDQMFSVMVNNVKSILDHVMNTDISVRNKMCACVKQSIFNNFPRLLLNGEPYTSPVSADQFEGYRFSIVMQFMHTPETGVLDSQSVAKHYSCDFYNGKVFVRS